MSQEPTNKPLAQDLGLLRSLVAADVLALLPEHAQDDPSEKISVIVEIDTNAALPPNQCHRLVITALEEIAADGQWQGQLTLHKAKSEMTDRYVFLDASYGFIRAFLNIFKAADTIPDPTRLHVLTVDDPLESRAESDAPSFEQLVSMIFRIWRDQPATPLTVESISTVKVDAARNVFASATGEGIIWAVVDTGVDGDHPHFSAHDNLAMPPGIAHVDLSSGSDVVFHSQKPPKAFDQVGHGTHVAGIIAGYWAPSPNTKKQHSATFNCRARAGQAGFVDYAKQWDKPVSGMAPKCKILSLKVLNGQDSGKVSNAIVALQYIRQQNLNRNTPKIHGVNISLSYPFDPEWYAAGMSPICKEIDRLVAMGVCVVVAAGNTGYAQVLGGKQSNAISSAGSICDPGNAKSAITVGATHRNRPREFGVSYFSSKGPTSDGRMKPDLIAPGERIISCQSNKDPVSRSMSVEYCEMSGTSMAAPHVSGAIACLLSARPEFIGRPEDVKQRILATATDLGLVSTHQGKGLLDVLQLITSSYEGGIL